MMEMRLNYKYSYVIIKWEFGLILKYRQKVILIIIISEGRLISNIYDVKLKCTYMQTLMMVNEMKWNIMILKEYKEKIRIKIVIIASRTKPPQLHKNKPLTIWVFEKHNIKRIQPLNTTQHTI